MGKNIVLVGLMGAGKSSVGKAISKKLHLDFIDTDEIIETEENCKISTIFQEKGENFFRELEEKTIEKISKVENKIISTGGGSIEREKNLENLKQNGLVIYLKANAGTLFGRIEQETNRPLLQNDNPLKTLEQLLLKREAQYIKSDIIINTENKTIDEITEEIIKVYNANS